MKLRQLALVSAALSSGVVFQVLLLAMARLVSFELGWVGHGLLILAGTWVSVLSFLAILFATEGRP